MTAFSLYFRAKLGDGVNCKTCEVNAMMDWKLFQKWNHKGQSLIEYAMVAAIVSAAVITMSTYVFRSVQSTQQQIQKQSDK
jgi:Flp pilus assembly pilin Flp